MSKVSKTVIYILLGLVAIYFLSPFIYMLFSAFKTEAEAIAFPPKLFPSEWRFQNFADAWNSQPFGRYFLNSVLVTVGTTIGQVLSCSLVAYGFARFNFKGKNVLFMILLSTMMIPWDVTMIPQYMEFNMFGWINTLKPLIVPAWFGSAYYIFLMRQFLMGIPKDFEEAARIDGSGEFNTFNKIVFPLMKPAIAVQAIFTFVQSWNNYFIPALVLHSDKKKTLPVLIAQLRSADFLKFDMGQVYVMIAFSIFPVIIVYILLSRFIVEGVSAGAVKG
mgnify:FL=1